MNRDRGSEGLVERLTDSQYIENLEASLEYYQEQVYEMDIEIEELKSENAYIRDLIEELKKKLARIEKL